MQRASFRILLEPAVRLLIHLPVAEHQRPNYLADFHELEYTCTLKNCQASVNFVKIWSVTVILTRVNELIT
jgi:hypothetical protein